MTEQKTPPAKTDGRLAFGVDVGGSGIKAAIVDVGTGELCSERLRVPTPVPSTPDRVMRIVTVSPCAIQARASTRSQVADGLGRVSSNQVMKPRLRRPAAKSA